MNIETKIKIISFFNMMVVFCTGTMMIFVSVCVFKPDISQSTNWLMIATVGQWSFCALLLLCSACEVYFQKQVQTLRPQEEAAHLIFHGNERDPPPPYAWDGSSLPSLAGGYLHITAEERIDVVASVANPRASQ